jgi:hypothetical protein
MNKAQNTRVPQVDLIRSCLEAGVVFIYGLMLDLVSRSVRDLRRELEFVTAMKEITQPAYLTVPIPFPHTPFFDECVSKNLFLPRTKLRDLDGTNLVLRPKDSLEDVVPFLREIRSMKGYRRRMLKSMLGFTRKYGRVLTREQMMVAHASPVLLTLYPFVTAPRELLFRRGSAARRTYISSTEPLDDTYVPSIRVASKFAGYFRPTMLTGDDGQLAEEVAADLSASRRPATEGSLVPVSAL